MKGKRSAFNVYISDIRQIVGYRIPVFIQPFLWRLHITITDDVTSGQKATLGWTLRNFRLCMRTSFHRVDCACAHTRESPWGCSLGRPRLSLSTGTSPFTCYLPVLFSYNKGRSPFNGRLSDFSSFLY
jgi:hypothetical protein